MVDTSSAGRGSRVCPVNVGAFGVGSAGAFMGHSRVRECL